MTRSTSSGSMRQVLPPTSKSASVNFSVFQCLEVCTGSILYSITSVTTMHWVHSGLSLICTGCIYFSVSVTPTQVFRALERAHSLCGSGRKTCSVLVNLYVLGAGTPSRYREQWGWQYSYSTTSSSFMGVWRSGCSAAQRSPSRADLCDRAVCRGGF